MDNKKAVIEGYICVTGAKSKPIKNPIGEYFYEVIQEKAFDESIHTYGIPVMTFNHDRVIATKSDIELHEDRIGLKFRASIDDVEVLAKAQTGKLMGCSFKFKSFRESKQIMNKEEVRVIEKMSLLDVSVLDKKPSHRSIVEVASIPYELQKEVDDYIKGNENKPDQGDPLAKYRQMINEHGSNH